MCKDRAVSILLPTYNRAELLEKCIDSVLEQTYPYWELIIYDDASTDETPQLAVKIAEKDSRIRPFRAIKKYGLPKIRNETIKLAQYDFIWFIEDDLILEKKCLEHLIRTYDSFSYKNENKIGCIAPRLIVNSDNYPYLNENKKFKEQICNLNPLTGCITCDYDKILENPIEVINVHACSLYVKDFVKKIGGYEEKAFIGNYAYEDIDLNFRLRREGYHLFFQSNAIVYHNMASFGGCRNFLYFRTLYYQYRNHILFLIRNFGMKSVYMIPSFFIFILGSTISYFLEKLIKNKSA